MISLGLLETIEAFKALDDNQLAAIQGHCKEIEFQRGDKLFTEGDDATAVWIVVEGGVDLRFELPGKPPTSKDHTVNTIKAKPAETKILGWSCFVPPYQMRLSAFCVSRSCKVVKIGKDNLIELFEKDVKMGYLILSYLIRVVGYRFHQFQDVVAEQMGKDLMSGW